MESIHYIGLDVHKKTIAYCVKIVNGEVVKQGNAASERKVLRNWLKYTQKSWPAVTTTGYHRSGTKISGILYWRLTVVGRLSKNYGSPPRSIAFKD